MSFVIRWDIPDAEWDKALAMRHQHQPGSDYDQNYLAHYDLLYGDVQVAYQERMLFQTRQDGSPGTVNLALIDLANQLSNLLANDLTAALPGTVATFSQSDDALEIAFARMTESFRVTTNLVASEELDVPEDALLTGIRQFLREFVAETQRRAPELLDWESLAALRS